MSLDKLSRIFSWKKWKAGGSLTGFLFVLPALLGFAVFVYRPLIHTLILSFHDWNMVSPTRDFVGFSNYREIFSSQIFYRSLWNTGVYGFWLVILIILFPLCIAIVLNAVPKGSRNFFRLTLFAPTVVSLGIASVIFVWIFNPIGGLLASVFESLGLTPVTWTTSTARAKVPILVSVAWKAFGYNMVLVLAGIGGVPNEVRQAAIIDGAVGLKMWRYIMLPLIAPTLVFIFVLTMSMAAEYVFTPIHVITGGGPQSSTTNVVFEIYRQAFRWFRVGLSSTFSILVFLIFCALLGLQMRLSERFVSYEER